VRVSRFLLFTCVIGYAQEPKLEFEVATVKPAAPPTGVAALMFQVRGGPGSDDPGRVTYTNISMRQLLTIAYGPMQPNQLSAPSSLENDKYDIAAKIPPGTTKEQFNGMLQNLLVERFNLKVHREIRNQPGYELAIAKSGLKMKETAEGAGTETPVDGRWVGGNPTAKDKDGRMQVAPGRSAMMSIPLGNGITRLSARNQAIASFGLFSQNFVHRVIVDKTGLSGKFDFNLDFVSEGAPVGATDDPAPDFLTAVQQQLGLKLEPVTIAIDVVVVDRVDKVPAGN
jgi:uncharacterized protein (TIGR03435 family)